MPQGEEKLDDLQWRKAKCSANNGACVEVASACGQISIRDSADPKGPVIRHSDHSWSMFLASVKVGRFNPGRVS